MPVHYIFLDGPQNVTVQSLVNVEDLKEGDKLTLKCSVQKSNPTVNQFTWYKNSQVQSETSETFIIRNVTAEDKGSYHCQADNGINTAKSDDLSVSVKCKYYIICITLFFPSTNKC